MDWAKNSEDKVTVSKSILSSGLSGRQHNQHFFFPSFSKSNSWNFAWSSNPLPDQLDFAHKCLDIKAMMSANKAFEYGLTKRSN